MKFVYLSKPAEKEYDFDSILSYTQTALEQVPDMEAWEIDEVYADGWVTVPNGISDLLRDLDAHKKKVTGIVLFSLEEITTEQLQKLIKSGKSIYCILASHLGVVAGPKADILIHTKEAKKYYSNVTSMKIRHGVKASQKSSGAAPFGYSYEDGNLVRNEHFPVLQEILRLRAGHTPYAEIAKRVNMSTPQIYGIVRTAEARGNE
jgi:hypothetical protein